MVFQLGKGTFRKFRRFIRACDRQDFEMAAKEMENSEWAKQTPSRVKEMAEMMRTGRYS
jgi:lysozyme